MILELKGITKTYGQQKVLDSVCFSVGKPEFFTILGPSGAGKTTLLKIITGFISSSGTVHFKGRRLNNGFPEGMVIGFQNPIMFNTSVFNNITYGLKIRKKTSNYIEGKLRDVLHIVRINDLKRNALSLSGGEVQRVALARLLMLDPELILLDEPTAHLDPSNVGNIEHILHKVNKEMGKTIILATHNINQAKRLSDRLMLLIDGRTVEISDNETFFNKPKSAETSRFLKGDIVW
ncbi:MAG: ABC transporter ATP-binding protein [Nanoarchaeota archaeon]|nr:ABC transporter ATP-binding protein [Nanoarchaeota archaeon]